MADADNKEEKGQDRQAEGRSTKGGGKLVALLLPIGAVAICAAMGFFVGRLFGTRGAAQNVSAAEQSGHSEAAQSPAPAAVDNGPSWYYDLEPVIGNLTDPGVLRYVRVAVTLEVSGMSEKDGTAFLSQKIPLIRNLLLLYLNSLASEDVQGEQNLRRMQTQITDILNQNLFGGTAGTVRQVLFREKSMS